MVCGLPEICSRIRGSTDLISEESGFLVYTYDADGFAQAMTVLSNDEAMRLNMGKVNKENSHKYSVDTIVETMKSIYES